MGLCLCLLAAPAAARTLSLGTTVSAAVQGRPLDVILKLTIPATRRASGRPPAMIVLDNASSTFRTPWS